MSELVQQLNDYFKAYEPLEEKERQALEENYLLSVKDQQPALAAGLRALKCLRTPEVQALRDQLATFNIGALGDEEAVATRLCQSRGEARQVMFEASWHTFFGSLDAGEKVNGTTMLNGLIRQIGSEVKKPNEPMPTIEVAMQKLAESPLVKTMAAAQGANAGLGEGYKEVTQALADHIPLERPISWILVLGREALRHEDVSKALEETTEAKKQFRAAESALTAAQLAREQAQKSLTDLGSTLGNGGGPSAADLENLQRQCDDAQKALSDAQTALAQKQQDAGDSLETLIAKRNQMQQELATPPPPPGIKICCGLYISTNMILGTLSSLVTLVMVAGPWVMPWIVDPTVVDGRGNKISFGPPPPAEEEFLATREDLERNHNLNQFHHFQTGYNPGYGGYNPAYGI